MLQSEAYLLDMLIHARKAVEFASGLTYERFTQSDLHQIANVTYLEVFRRIVTLPHHPHP